MNCEGLSPGSPRAADAALRDTERDPVHDRSRFEAIADGAKQMSRLTNDLLLLAGADRSLERELFVVDLVATLNKLAKTYALRFSEAGIALNFAPDGAATVYGNPAQIERILTNLVENALRYTRGRRPRICRKPARWRRNSRRGSRLGNWNCSRPSRANFRPLLARGSRAFARRIGTRTRHRAGAGAQARRRCYRDEPAWYRKHFRCLLSGSPALVSINAYA